MSGKTFGQLLYEAKVEFCNKTNSSPDNDHFTPFAKLDEKDQKQLEVGANAIAKACADIADNFDIKAGAAILRCIKQVNR